MNLISLPALVAAISLTTLARAEFAFETKDGTLRLLDDGKLITSFRTDYRIPYLYPLVSPSGANIARHWPMDKDAPTEEQDHPHHRGLWLAHGSVNGYDFWADADKKDASIKIKSVYGEKVVDGTAVFQADLYWVAEGGKGQLIEFRRFSFSRPDADTLRIDITSRLSPIKDEVVFGDTKEGTFALRTDRTLRVVGKEAKATLTNSNGETNAAAWGKRAAWAAYSGPDELGKPAVVAILNNPSSFRHPTHWHARDYGLLATNPFGIHDFEKGKPKNAGRHILRKGEDLTLSHTVIIHRGTLESARLDAFLKATP